MKGNNRNPTEKNYAKGKNNANSAKGENKVKGKNELKGEKTTQSKGNRKHSDRKTK